jgi:carboxymethylenebutenolidase
MENETMRKFCKIVMGLLVCLIFAHNAWAEPIYHEKYYPDGSGPFPAVIALHTSGGFKSVKHLIQRYVDDGFAVYAPDFFKRHGLTPRTRMETFSTYRENIEEELTEIVDLMKNDPKINKKNVFAVGFSNGGFWVGYLTGSSKVNAGVSHYGVWKANMGREITNPYPMKYFSKSSTPILALHGEDDGTQRMKFVEQAWDEVKDRGGRLETHVYSGADHAWDQTNSKKWDYNEKVDKDSHKKTIEFFKKHMK